MMATVTQEDGEQIAAKVLMPKVLNWIVGITSVLVAAGVMALVSMVLQVKQEFTVQTVKQSAAMEAVILQITNVAEDVREMKDVSMASAAAERTQNRENISKLWTEFRLMQQRIGDTGARQ